MKKLLYRLTEPAGTIPDERKIFSNHALKLLILPLFFEQLLEVLVGVSDTFMVSYAGEAAVSGVSLVNMFNTVFLYLFSALAAGGAVVVSQYIGSRDRKNGNLAAGQLIMTAAVFSAAAMAVCLILNRQLLRLLFGEVDRDVMEACVTYLQISAYSYPAIAIYNAGAAIYRSMGKTNVTMNISLAANGINIAGNALSDEAARLVVILVLIHNIFNALFYPLSGALANGLRAAGDVKFTMYVSVFSTIACRVVFSVLFGIWMDPGVIGIAFAMCLDWMIRAVFFWIRFRGGRWKEFRVIG